jgi:hypothetical protein
MSNVFANSLYFQHNRIISLSAQFCSTAHLQSIKRLCNGQLSVTVNGIGATGINNDNFKSELLFLENKLQINYIFIRAGDLKREKCRTGPPLVT